MDDSKVLSNTITKDDIIERYKEEYNSEPLWNKKKIKEMSNQERLEYQKYRNIIIQERKKRRRELKNEPKVEEVIDDFPEEVPAEEFDDDEEELGSSKLQSIPVTEKIKDTTIKEEIDKSKPIEYPKTKEPKTKEVPSNTPNSTNESMDGYYIEYGKTSDEEKSKLISHTMSKALDELLSPEEKETIAKVQKEDELITNYLSHHNIDNQEKLNYAIEHDERFRLFLSKAERLKEFYTGKHIDDIKRKQEEVDKELIKEAKKDKKKRIFKKFEKKKQSNNFNDAKKELDLTPYRNKKMESQGFILCVYLRKNGLANLRYVKMDEVGQIKVDGYVYHERDATYRFGKKNDPVLVIMEGSLVPINKETLKEHLGFQCAEAQKLVIKGIEQAEVVKAGGIDENAKKPFTPPKWLIIVGIIIAVGLYAYFGGFA